MTVTRVYPYRGVGKVNGRVKFRLKVIAKSFDDAEATLKKWVQEQEHVTDPVVWEVFRIKQMNTFFSDLGR